MIRAEFNFFTIVVDMCAEFMPLTCNMYIVSLFPIKKKEVVSQAVVKLTYDMGSFFLESETVKADSIKVVISQQAITYKEFSMQMLMVL